KQLLETFKGLAEDFGKPMTKMFQDFGEGFGRLSSGAKEFAVVAGGIAAAIGPAILAIDLLVVSAGKVGELTGTVLLGFSGALSNIAFAVSNNLVGALSAGETALL